MCEPLKGKIHWYEDGQPLVEFVDVKSAVEGFQKEIDEYVTIQESYQIVDKLIKKWFEDVIE